ncbi:MAG: DUF1018 domain-containing protein [Candidatus Wallbacteria bacterium]
MQNMATITSSQIKIIHTIVKKIGMPDAEYRLIIERVWPGKKSCKELTEFEAERLIKAIQEVGYNKYKVKTKYYNPYNKKKHNDLAGREEMASPAQLRMIEGMWADVSYVTDEIKREQALRKFVEKKFHISALRFLPARMVERVVKTLQAMKFGRKREAA